MKKTHMKPDKYYISMLNAQFKVKFNKLIHTGALRWEQLRGNRLMAQKEWKKKSIVRERKIYRERTQNILQGNAKENAKNILSVNLEGLSNLNSFSTTLGISIIS